MNLEYHHACFSTRFILNEQEKVTQLHSSNNGQDISTFILFYERQVKRGKVTLIPMILTTPLTPCSLFSPSSPTLPARPRLTIL